MKTILISLALVFSFQQVQAFQPILEQRIPLTLKNNSLKSIPLKIPGYMNPNLSPMSTSGVDLEIGQVVYFSFKGKKRVLLTITEDLAGKTLIVNELIKKREKELLLAKSKKG